jgi:hypothetical protein
VVERPDPGFASAVERECARLFDHLGIAWQYEPDTFVLERDEQGRVREAFTPDFYLPELNIYLEITTMRQALVTRKQHKVRRLQELRPDLRVKLFARRDVERLVACHGISLGDAAA